MQLPEYLTALGVAKSMELFDVSDVTYYSWRGMKSIPEPAKANKIIKESHGLVSWAEIYQPYFDKVTA